MKNTIVCTTGFCFLFTQLSVWSHKPIYRASELIDYKNTKHAMLFIRKFNEITEKFAVKSHSKRERKILVSTGCHSKECPPPRFVINIATTAGF